LRILLSGSSGFIGSEVFFYLKSQGHEVVRLKRGKSQDSDSDSLFWDPDLEKYQLDSFEGFDAVIHLAGEPIFGLWTEKKKQRIFSSRIASTELLVKILSQTTNLPKTFISASAVGYYGNRGEEWLTENSSAGEGFLASVCSAWEAAADGLSVKGVRIVHTRFGVVLDKEGGMLKKMCLFFWLGLGCLLGTGEQWMSWIARSDLVRAIAFCLKTESIKGPVNCVSPNPVRQKEFARSLAKSLARPLFLRIPAWLLRGMLGDMAEGMLLASQRVKPEKLLQHNFSYQTMNLEGVLTNEHRTGTRK
jgi:uncharacterized protein (TIGR01777 family)